MSKKNAYILKDSWAKTDIHSIVPHSADIECLLVKLKECLLCTKTVVRRDRHGILSSVCFIPAF